MTVATKLPKGYIDMGYEEYTALDIDTLRAIYVKLLDIVAYTMGSDNAVCAVRNWRPVTPVEWVTAVKRVVCECARCKGTGTYYWGASINGRMTHSASCARCGGDGRMTFDDMRRGRAYDNYAISRVTG